MFEFKRIEEVTNNLQKPSKEVEDAFINQVYIIAHLLETIYASY